MVPNHQPVLVGWVCPTLVCPRTSLQISRHIFRKRLEEQPLSCWIPRGHPPLQLSSLAEWVPLRPGKMDYRVVRKNPQLKSSWDLWIFLPPKYGIGFDPSPCGKMESRWDPLPGGRAGFPPLEMAYNVLVWILQGWGITHSTSNTVPNHDGCTGLNQDADSSTTYKQLVYLAVKQTSDVQYWIPFWLVISQMIPVFFACSGTLRQWNPISHGGKSSTHIYVISQFTESKNGDFLKPSRRVTSDFLVGFIAAPWSRFSHGLSTFGWNLISHMIFVTFFWWKIKLCLRNPTSDGEHLRKCWWTSQVVLKSEFSLVKAPFFAS